MIPLVLGGIALAAVGYGLKEYCDSEGCPWDEETDTNLKSKSDDVKLRFENFHSTKVSLYKDFFVENLQLLAQVKNMKSIKLKYITATFPKELHETIDDNVADMLTASEEILLYVKDLLRSSAREMNAILEHSTDYTTYTKEEQLLFINAYKLLKLTGKLCHTSLVIEEGSLSEKYEDNMEKLFNFVKENWNVEEVGIAGVLGKTFTVRV